MIHCCEKFTVSFTLNGREASCGAEPRTTLLRALRAMGTTSVKRGCEEGECGACTVLLNGVPQKSCMVLAYEAEGASVVTAEGLIGRDGSLHPVQQAFVEEGAIQCGFCTPGLVLVTYALLRDNPEPADREIKEYLAGNLCRCTGYEGIFRAVRRAAKMIAECREATKGA